MNSNTPKPQRTGKKTQQQITNLSPQQIAQKQAIRTERNRRRRINRRNKIKMTMSSSYAFRNPPSFDNTVRKEITKSKPGISEAGLAFLKCAFAPPDFTTTDVAGYPDTYNGKSLTKKHRLVVPVVFPKSTDYYILIAPIPGVAYCTIAKPSGAPIVSTDVWFPAYYADYAQLFPSPDTATNKLVDFRFISNHIEIIPSVNQMSWTGSIQAIKLQLSQIIRNNSTTSANIITFTGAQAANGFTNAPQYSGPFINGIFCGAYASDSSRDFVPIQENVSIIPSAVTPGDFTQIGTSVFTGLDNSFETICLKISGVTKDENSCIIKTWACVEYKTLPGTDLSEYERFSPNDPVALEVYKKIINSLPTAVTYMENENFWNRVLSMIRRISGTMSVIPGPYGMIASGVHGLASGIEQLVL